MNKEYKEANKYYIITWIIIILLIIFLMFGIPNLPKQTQTDIETTFSNEIKILKNIIIVILIYVLNHIDLILSIINTILLININKKIKSR